MPMSKVTITIEAEVPAVMLSKDSQAAFASYLNALLRWGGPLPTDGIDVREIAVRKTGKVRNLFRRRFKS